MIEAICADGCARCERVHEPNDTKMRGAPYRNGDTVWWQQDENRSVAKRILGRAAISSNDLELNTLSDEFPVLTESPLLVALEQGLNGLRHRRTVVGR